MTTVPPEPSAQEPLPPLLERTLGSVGCREIISIDLNASIEAARATMLDKGISSLVVRQRGQPVGMLTRTDVLRKVELGMKDWGLVREVMTPLIASLPESTSLPDAARQMVDSQIHRVVVTFEDGSMGLASLTDVARALGDATELLSGTPAGLKISAMAEAAPPMRQVYLDSFQRATADEDAFFEAFEKRFLSRSAFIQVRFKDLPPERVRQIMKRSVKLAHAAIATGQPGLARLNAEGRAHSRERRNIDPKLHELWADSLVATMRDFDPKRDVIVEVAWRVMLGHVVRVMSRNY